MKKTFLIPLLVVFLFAGIVNANSHSLPDPGLLPDSPFYFLDIALERLGSLVTFGDLSKAQRHLGLAEERLVESRALANKGDSSRAEKTIGKYQEQLGKALAKAEKAKSKGKDADAVLEKIAEATVRHQVVLAEIYEKVPEQAKEAIQKAMENSARGHDTALSAVSGEKQEEVRGRVEQETKDVEERLEELRNEGVPIPGINKRKKEQGLNDNTGEDAGNEAVVSPPEDVVQTQPGDVNKSKPFPAEGTITARYTYENGIHTYKGFIDVPSPCYELTHEVIILESFPEQVHINFTSEIPQGKENSICAQVITPKEFEVSFQASQEATVRATLNGAIMDLVVQN